MLNLYASGLDLEALVPRLKRVHTTLITSIAAIVLLYLGTFALDAVDSITAMTLVLNGVAVPWVVVNLLGFLVARRGRYDPHDLQAFNEGPPRRALLVHRRLEPARDGRVGRRLGVRPAAPSAPRSTPARSRTSPAASTSASLGSALVAAAVYLLALRHLARGELKP